VSELFTVNNFDLVGKSTDAATEITSKLAVILVFEFNVTVSGLVVDPLDHPLKLYPEVGVAVKLTWVPLAKVPPPVTDPPSPALCC